jgi:hypothetical protein
MAKNRASGLCAVAASHGPSVKGFLCADCALTQHRHNTAARLRRIETHRCAVSEHHGPATHGLVCEACNTKRRAEQREIRKARKARKAREARVLTCALGGAAHGPATVGVWCQRCADLRTAAAQRVRRATSARATTPPAQPAKHTRPLADAKAYMDRTGNIDSEGLVDLLLATMPRGKKRRATKTGAHEETPGAGSHSRSFDAHA